MSLIARNVLNNLRVQQYIKYSTVTNKVGLTLSCDNCRVNNLQYKFLNMNESKLHRGCFTPYKMFITSSVDYSFTETLKKVFVPLNLPKKRQAYALGFHWFATIDQINYEEFFKLLNMPDTFYTWYKITEFHVWMILVRLMQQGSELRWIREAVISAMWEDAEKRAKIVDPTNKKHKTNFKDLYQRFQASLYIYDEGLLSNDVELANALWYQFFDKRCEDPRILEAMVSYCRAQISHLLKVQVDTEGVTTNFQIWMPLKNHFHS